MTRSEREHLAKPIVKYHVRIVNRQKKLTVNHFSQEGIPRPTIYRIIKKFEESGAVGDKPRTGCPKKLSNQQLGRLKRLADQKTGISTRQIALKFNVSAATIHRYLKAMGIVYREKKRAPRYTDKQLEEIPKRARRLYQTITNHPLQLILDDEKYFSLHNESVPSNRGFYTSDPSLATPEVKFKRAQKFAPKILVWVAISENGISTPFFAKQKQAVTQTTYLNECIIPHLMPFIEKYHNKTSVLFWPDLARSHYGAKVTEYLEDNGIQFVPRENNPQNCPQCRPIETRE